jgi:tRNA(Ile)-lysidine synthase
MRPTEADSASSPNLLERFAAHIRSSRLLPDRTAVTVALSGGLDSVVLLDLLLAQRGSRGWHVSAAHFDHRMRRESAADAGWVAELCRQRRVPLRLGRAGAAPRCEAEAREMRYEFLHAARADLGAHWLATAHQADDQAETVLFRLLRGSGLAGLQGIPAQRPPHIVRPLLPFWRADIESYCASRGLEFLVDPSNLDVAITRNFLRHRLIPEIEGNNASDFRRQLCRLAELAGRATRAVDGAVQAAMAGLVVEASKDRIVVARARFLAYDTRVRAHLLRAFAARVGPRPGRVGTRVALEFINTCSSG